MRRALITPLTKINLGNSVSVQRVTLVRVDNNYKETRIGMDHLGLVTGFQVPEYRSIIKECKIDHVLAFLKLGRIDLSNLRTFVSELFMTNRNHALAGRVFKVSGLQGTLTVSSTLGVRDPYRLLGIIGLLLISPLHIHRREQKLSWVWVGLTRLGELDMTRHDGSKQKVK